MDLFTIGALMISLVVVVAYTWLLGKQVGYNQGLRDARRIVGRGV